jgi:hypothetical protein
VSTTSNPVPLTPAVAATIVPPSSAPQLAAVVVQNASPYTLAVVIAGAQAVIQPYTADLFPTTGTGSPITILPSNPDNTSGVSANAQAVWYGPDEIPDTTAYPAALTPPPVAVGLAVAAQLLAGGVPNVYNWTDLGQFVVPIGPVPVVEIDVHGYASVIIYQTDLPAGTTAIAYWFTDNARVGQVGTDLLSSPTAGISALPAVVPVEGSFLRLNTNDAVTHAVRVIGTNRPVPGGHPIVNGYSTAGFQASTGNVAMANGQTVPMNIDRGALFQGPAAFEFIVTGTVVKGSWILRMMTSQGLLSLDLADTTEAHVLGPDTHFHRLGALPATEYTLSFLCNAAGTANAFTRAIPNY